MNAENHLETAPTPASMACSSPAAPIRPPITAIPGAPPAVPAVSGESERAAEAFRIYLELGPSRRYSAVVKKVGTSMRTIKRWATDFDWRGRIRTLAHDHADRYVELDRQAQSEDVMDAAARFQALRDRQLAVAESLLDAAERYLEHADTQDLHQMSFADACKALDVASRLGQQAAVADDNPPKALDQQLSALLDQVYGDPSPAEPSATAATASKTDRQDLNPQRAPGTGAK